MSNTTNNQVKSLIQIRKSLARGNAGNLAENQALIDFLRIQADMLAEFDKTNEVIKDLMDQHDIKKIVIDTADIKGTLQFVPYPTYQADGKIAPRFFKQVLDGKKIRAHMDLHAGELPKGVAVKTVMQFKKSIKRIA